MAIFLVTDKKFTYYRQLASIFFMILQAYICTGQIADVQYTKNI